MNWTIFATLTGIIEPPVVAAASSIAGQFLSAMSAVLTAALTVYVAITGYQMFAGHMAEPLRDVWVRIFKGAVVVFLMQAGSYNQYVTNLFLTGIPNDISNALGGGQISGGAFDHAWNLMFKGGLEVWQNTSMWDVGLQILILLYWFSGSVAIALGWIIWQSAQILLALFVAVGPLIIAMMLFNSLRSIFERWIGALFSMIFLQAMVIILLIVLIKAENQILSSLTTGGGNVIAQAEGLFAPIILFIAAGLLVWQMPSAATALAGGMHFHAYALHAATLGRAMNVVNNVTRAGARGAVAAGSAGVARAYNAAVGRPISLYGPP